MRCSAVSWCWNRLLGQWKKYLDGEVLARQDALLLMGRTVREVQRGRQEQRISFLATRGHSVAVWKVLDRQRTAWKDCLALFEIQIASFSPLRRSFLEGCLVAFPKLWKRLSYAMLSAWHPEEKFLAVYTQLMASETIVQFISIVSAAIREQPQLGGILPVSHLVLLRCYELGKAQPETALSCCRIVALAKPELLSRAEREELAFGYAMLFAFRDQWGVALSVLNASREVRPSAKRLFWLHISRMGQWVKAVQCHETLEPSFITSAIEHASHWSYALRVYEQWKTHDAAQALIARKDVIDTIGWEASLCLCRLSGIRSYGLLRPVLSAIPDNHPQRMQLLSNAIRVTEESMYAGTLTRRAFQFVKRGKWMDAIGLLCGCRYFDVALPIVPYAPKGAVLPHELLSFEEAVCRMKLPSSPKDVLSFEDQMAAALCRKWRHVGTLPTNARLKSLMLARGVLHHLADSPGVKENGEVQCFTFQSGELSRLVCLAAGSKTQQYFRQVIPRELHEHHFGSRRVEGQFVTSQKYEAFLTAGAVVVDGEGCNSLCAMVVEHLRACGNLTGETFIRELSRCLAAGRIQLPLVCRHELSLAVLRAAFHFHRLDSTLTARIALTTPSHYLAARPDALGSCVNALLLTGKWERAISLARKAEPPNPHSIAALAYVAPRPVALATLKVLWRANPQDRSTLLLQDLLHGDTRRAMDELRVSAPGVKAARGKNDVQWRRRVLGACCCLIRSSQSMLSVVREAGLSSFCALDVDEHGLQRLIHVLPWEKALTAISDADGNNEVVDEHWVLTVCVKPQIPAEAVGKGVSLFRYSALLNTVLVYHQSVEQKALQAAIKAVARYQEVVLTDYNADKIYLRTLVTLLRGVLQRFDDDEWKTTSPWLVVRRVFNQAVETLEMTQMGRDARRCLPASLREDKPLHAFLIIGFFYHEMSRSLQIPILASITSKLLGVAARETRDFMAALYFFKCLKQPTNHERSLLVFALRDVSDAMSLLMTAGRFVHPRPEQVLVWSDSARGSERWMLSIELLSQSPPPLEKLVELCQGWSWAEALRTLELLRRIKGSSPEAETYSTLVRECHPSAR
uniref:Uncharacterized protein n=1 Tax=Trypanosoma congolense (strain IL3000) TaxID=1068625 RepID=G0UKS9_TRYCI|nr:conserved hypothetical protein [Trypanosoma congolense IL3000]